MLAEVVTWPEAVMGIGIAICVASYFMDKWPWEDIGFIQNNYYDCDCEEEEDPPDADPEAEEDEHPEVN